MTLPQNTPSADLLKILRETLASTFSSHRMSFPEENGDAVDLLRLPYSPVYKFVFLLATAVLHFELVNPSFLKR